MKITARITRTYHVEVDAEYGDTPESLRAKAAEVELGDPDAESMVLLDAEHAEV